MFVIVIRQDSYKKVYYVGTDDQGYWITSENVGNAMSFSDFTVARNFANDHKLWSARIEATSWVTDLTGAVFCEEHASYCLGDTKAHASDHPHRCEHPDCGKVQKEN